MKKNAEVVTNWYLHLIGYARLHKIFEQKCMFLSQKKPALHKNGVHARFFVLLGTRLKPRVFKHLGPPAVVRQTDARALRRQPRQTEGLRALWAGRLVVP